MSAAVKELDISGNNLGDGLTPALALLSPVEAARQVAIIAAVRNRAAEAKQAMAEKAGRLSLKPEKTEPEHVMELRSRRDGMLEPLLLALAHPGPPSPLLTLDMSANRASGAAVAGLCTALGAGFGVQRLSLANNLLYEYSKTIRFASGEGLSLRYTWDNAMGRRRRRVPS